MYAIIVERYNFEMKAMWGNIVVQIRGLCGGMAIQWFL